MQRRCRRCAEGRRQVRNVLWTCTVRDSAAVLRKKTQSYEAEESERTPSALLAGAEVYLLLPCRRPWLRRCTVWFDVDGQTLLRCTRIDRRARYQIGDAAGWPRRGPPLHLLLAETEHARSLCLRTASRRRSAAARAGCFTGTHARLCHGEHWKAMGAIWEAGGRACSAG
jgi:hypothetical protein